MQQLVWQYGRQKQLQRAFIILMGCALADVLFKFRSLNQLLFSKLTSIQIQLLQSLKPFLLKFILAL